MKSNNLYTFTREVPNNVQGLYMKSLFDMEDEMRIRKEEIEMIEGIVSELENNNACEDIFDNWFYSFSIPQIGKEFDLLKIDANKIAVNIELKSQLVSEEKIREQLEKNQYYLSNIAEELYCFTIIKSETSENIIYKYETTLKEASFEEVIESVLKIKNPITKGIEELFRSRDYLISPINSPGKFLGGRYYLNNQQLEIKSKIIKSIEEDKCFWGILGDAGTGKTLLIYDIAVTLANEIRVCIIHSGILSEGHIYLNKELKNIDIISAKYFKENYLYDYDLIIIDECQRIYQLTLKNIVNSYVDGNIIGVICAYDPKQSLAISEIKRNNTGFLRELEFFREESLGTRIRTNKEIMSFIRNMLRLSDKPRGHIEYSNIDIIWANDIEEAYIILDKYKSDGYEFLTYTPSNYVSNSIDSYSNNMNSHRIIGQEFDSVVIFMDDNFRYSSDGDLEGKIHPNPDYLFPKLFYQNITRAREKICIIVIDNEDLFDKLLRIKEHCLES